MTAIANRKGMLGAVVAMFMAVAAAGCAVEEDGLGAAAPAGDEPVAAQESEVSCNGLLCYSSGCTSVGLARTGACVAAESRWCRDRGFGMGVSQQLGNGVIGTLCAPATQKRIWKSTLTARHSGCTSTTLPQDPNCMAAVHRECQSFGFTGGISQEEGAWDVTAACFNAPFYADIPLSELTARHPGCASAGQSQTNDCVAAIDGACHARNYAGGIAQEVGYRWPLGWVFGVACFDAATSFRYDAPIL